MRSFEIYGKWSVQTNKRTSIDTCVCNAVTLVWGSLRLAPTRRSVCPLMIYQTIGVYRSAKQTMDTHVGCYGTTFIHKYSEGEAVLM